GFVNRTDAFEAKQKPIEIRPRDKIVTARAAYFAEEVRREIVAMYGEDKLYTGGLSVRTTVDPQLQGAAEVALRRGLVAYDRRHGWRGPVAKLSALDDWAAQLAERDRPNGAGDWILAVTLETDAQGAAIGFADGNRARIPFAELRWARRTLPEQKVGPEPKAAADVLKPGDVILVEALDPEAEQPEAFALRQIPNVQGAIVAIDPHTGRVVAMQGGYDFDMSVFNRATQALRQTGSAFKPFVYLAALDNGYTPATLILDAPFVLPAAPGRERWEPNNYSRKFNGPTPMRVGIEKSYNAMTVRLAQSIGMGRVADYVRRFGITSKVEPVLAASLGAEEATLLQMTAGYAMLVNGGKRVTPTLIDRIQDRDGRTIYRHDGRQCRGCQGGLLSADDPMPYIADVREQLVDERTAYQMSSMLEGVVRRGTGAKIGAALPNAPLAGKTGTTNDFRDAWFIGFSPELAVGVYV
ncbi:MAG: penicillin-binding transpeptidase domain-containing protein, partial [Pseudomonadota bacterium]